MADYFQGIFGGVETIAAGLFAAATFVIQDQYDDIAKDYYHKYKAQRDFYYSTFQQNGELPFNTEQFGIIFYGPDYVGQTSAYYDALQPLVAMGYFPPGVWNWFNPELANRRAQFVQRDGAGNPNFGYWYRKAQMYSPNYSAIFGLITTDQSQSSYIDMASINDDWNSYQNRYEEHKRDIFRERRWAGQMGSLAYGVKEAYAVEAGLGASTQNFDEAHASLMSEFNSISDRLSTSAAFNSMQKALREDLGSVPDYQKSYFLTNVLPADS